MEDMSSAAMRRRSYNTAHLVALARVAAGAKALRQAPSLGSAHLDAGKNIDQQRPGPQAFGPSNDNDTAKAALAI
jgi:hypothetical protein